MAASVCTREPRREGSYIEDSYNFIDGLLLILIAGMTAFGTAIKTRGRPKTGPA